MDEEKKKLELLDQFNVELKKFMEQDMSPEEAKRFAKKVRHIKRQMGAMGS